MSTRLLVAPSPLVDVAVVTVVVLGILVTRRFLRARLKLNILRLLRVVAVSQEVQSNCSPPYRRFPAFGQCNACLRRALEHLDQGNVAHAEELFRQGKNYLECVPETLLNSLRKRAKRRQLPAPEDFIKPTSTRRPRESRTRLKRDSHKGEADTQKNPVSVPLSVQAPLDPQAAQSAQINGGTTSCPAQPGISTNVWDVAALVSEISRLSEGQNRKLAVELVSPKVIKLLKAGGELLAYERMGELRDALNKLDSEFSTLFMKEVSSKFMRSLRAASQVSLPAANQAS